MVEEKWECENDELVYRYMETHCVGIANAKTSDELLDAMRCRYAEFENVSTREIRYCLERIRRNATVTRHIGSSSKRGYWLTTEEDDAAFLSRKVKGVKEDIEECLRLGISPDCFYKALNEWKGVRLPLHGQENLEEGKPDVLLTSDDLAKTGGGGNAPTAL